MFQQAISGLLHHVHAQPSSSLNPTAAAATCKHLCLWAYECKAALANDLQDVLCPVGAAVCHGRKALHCNGAIAAVAGALQAGAGGALKARHLCTTLVPASSGIVNVRQ